MVELGHNGVFSHTSLLRIPILYLQSSAKTLVQLPYSNGQFSLTLGEHQSLNVTVSVGRLIYEPQVVFRTKCAFGGDSAISSIFDC
ncbi:hypothetical protein PSBY109024_07745 [Pseudoalteromonas byunsanensis]